ncbi:MAG: hypothetical protein NVSMB51_03500 [Solirubrobacteraceae bacterium]
MRAIVMAVLLLVAAPNGAAARPRVPLGPTGATGPAAMTGPGPGTPVVPTAAPGPGMPPVDASAPAGSLDGPGSLAGNGFGSPECAPGARAGAYGPQAASDCKVSGVSTAAAPLDHYAFDVHIDTGPTKIDNSIFSVLQSVLLGSVWTALVWLVHVVIVALQWCYAIDLLGPETTGPVAGALLTLRDALSVPWLALLLSGAGVALAYRGLILRHVAESLGQAALMLCMMAAGLWLVADPQGTIGQAHELADTAGAGSIAAIVGSDAAAPRRGLRDSLATIFAGAVTDPWCYMEFGDVEWCRNPARMSPSLRAEAMRIASIDRAVAGCHHGSVAGLPPNVCSSRDTLARAQLTAQAAALERAHANGELFLALPPSSRPRNSIHSDAANPSLLHALCGGDDLGACPAATARLASFRTERGTWPRAGGLLLISAGTTGMLLLFGFIALRLLGASLMTVVFLLLAPVAALAPTLGQGGRDAFKLWAGRLLGAVLAKLLYSVMLGVLLLVVHMLQGLQFLGWWMQWLLVAAFWWLAFLHRHRLLDYVIVTRGTTNRARLKPALDRRQLARAAAGLRVSAGRLRLPGAPALRSPPSPPGLSREPRPPENVPAARRAQAEQQARRVLEAERSEARAMVAGAAANEPQLRWLRERGARLREQREVAVRAGDVRRSTSLARRSALVEDQLRSLTRDLDSARAEVLTPEPRRSPEGSPFSARDVQQRSAALDAQASRRPQLVRPGDERSGARDYQSLVALAGISRREWPALTPPAKRVVKLKIDRELELRRAGSAGRSAPRSVAAPQRRTPERPPPLMVPRRGRQFAKRFRGDPSR